MKLLLVESEAEKHHRLSDRLRSCKSDWSLVSAESGQQALELLESNEFAALVTDLQRFGSNGLELLDTVAQRHPQVLRIALSEQTDEATVSHISTIHQCLPYEFDVEDLIEIVNENQAHKPTIGNQKVLEAIGRKGCLPSIPENLVRLNEALDADDTNLALIASIVSEDPSLAAKILQLANSAIFGLRYPVKDVNRGVSVVGKSTVRAIAVSNAIFSVSQYDSLLSPDKLFDHCFEVAATARTLCQVLDIDSLDRQSTLSAALLHDVGKIVLVNSFPKEYERILKDDEEECEFWQKEANALGVSHQVVGAHLMKLWGIPEEITRLIECHHDFKECATGDRLSQIVFASNWLTNNAQVSVLEPYLGEQTVPAEIGEFANELLRWRDQSDGTE